jgi:hypothetical protein
VTMMERMQEGITKEHELTFLIDRLSHKLWIDWLIFKSVAPMPRKEVHVQMGDRVAVKFPCQPFDAENYAVLP